ncbi:MAG: GNAT family N-acetyltransferase [Rhodocyclaceae bacterium]|uniref:GNAT family N-acetyltransferase n=1 Tax=Accumulibacter sp. TaxID=2053492 RepID=UPI001A430A0B|nr:GNAT family N-acetyltransferase [Accumulibacter sp.]MBL8495646.1 GNAT family N-acetyltransferase [Rhodocyclaceae bacterium]HMV56143.1 GNAT family N-acetyltransferase [Nitrospira sp.]HNB66618.1 GNAT family N-acetyltransferase [Accumulibacter sp.]
MLAAVQLRHWLFGKRYVSMPFCDWTGILADDEKTECRLLRNVLLDAQVQRIGFIELRQNRPLVLAQAPAGSIDIEGTSWTFSDANSDNKVRMLLDLPDDADALMRGFRSKLRSQIRKPFKEGLVVRRGGRNLVTDFYRVFAENMRDLGSPVHSCRLLEEVVDRFGEHAQVFVVYGAGLPIAGSVTLGLGEVLCNPWASALRRHVERAPNMMLYWAMLEFACENGYRRFDFGRSTANEGTYRFKEQWGAHPEPIYWYRFVRGERLAEPVVSAKGRLSWAMNGWKHLPVSVTRVMGPIIRRHISL